MLSWRSLWCDLAVVSSQCHHRGLARSKHRTSLPPGRSRSLFTRFLLTSILACLLHGAIGQHCPESSVVTFPGFRCCKESLYSESGWKWICFADGELPTEPPADLPETTTSAIPDVTNAWTTATVTTTIPPTTLSPTTDFSTTSSVSPTAGDPGRTSKAVKVNSSSSTTSESVETTSPVPQVTTVDDKGLSPSEIALSSTTRLDVALTTPTTPDEVTTASPGGGVSSQPTAETIESTDSSKKLIEKLDGEQTDAGANVTNPEEITATEERSSDQGVDTEISTTQIPKSSTSIASSTESTPSSIVVVTTAQSELSTTVQYDLSQSSTTSPKATTTSSMGEPTAASIETVSISTTAESRVADAVQDATSSGGPHVTTPSSTSTSTSASVTSHVLSNTSNTTEAMSTMVTAAAEPSTIVTPTELSESLTTELGESSAPNSAAEQRSTPPSVKDPSTSATPDVPVEPSAAQIDASATPQPAVTPEPAKVTTSRTTRELRISTTTLVQQSTTPKPVTLQRRRRDLNPFPIGDFLRKSGLEESQSALEISYARRPYGSHVTIDCETASPNIRGLFRHLGVKDVTSVKYVRCNVPGGRLRFVDIFEGNTRNITKLELNRPHTPEGPLVASLFDGIAASIVELHIIWSAQRDALGVTSLSEDFFKHFESLTGLSLKSNALEGMPTSVKFLKKLKALDISMNLITIITSSMFAGLESLTTLYLAKNPIVRFESKPFADLRHLTTLELNAVQASEVPENLLEGLSSLTYLKMDSWTNLKSVPPKLFSSTPHLETLHFSEAMSIGSLPDGIFDGMFRLNTTYVRSCNLTSVPAKLFGNAPLIKIIDFSGNALSELPDGFFSENAKLERVFLGGNRIQTLKNEFEMLYALKELNLNRNHLTEISSKAFENLISLQTLDISRNRITKVEKNALYHLKKLEKLDIRENQLETFGGPTPTFSTGSPIREVYLSKNGLTAFPRIQYHTLPKLSILDLDDNVIPFFAVPLFASLDTKVFVRRNRLESISVELAKSYPKQESVYNSAVGTHRFDLEGNPFKCDCHIYNFLRYLRKEMKPEVAEFEHVDKYRCTDRNQTLLSVKLDLLSCRMNDCPPGCECFLRAHDASTHVRCRELGLAAIPKLPLNVTHLDFEGNVLKRYPVDLAQYSQLKEAILDGNNIDNIDELFTKPPPNLQMLSLSGNRLEGLRPITANTSYRMALSNNPWICDCSSIEFKRFVLSNIVNIPDYRSIACKNSYMVNGTEVTLLNDIPDDVFCPPDVSAYQASVIALSILFIIALLIIALYYKNRQLIIAYVYIHFYNVFICFFSESDLDEDKKFDAFISYSSNDRDIVMALLQELEKPQGDESSENLFKLCIHERDWLPGYNISWNIVNSVQNSRRTILILSQDFLKSLWFEVEFRTAYVQMMEDRINRLIVIIKGEIPPKESLDSDLRFLLGTKTYLEWGEKWFWEKLKYAMPHKGNLSGPLKDKIKPSELHKVLPMSVLTNKNQVPNSETVVRVEDAIENAQNNKAAKRGSPDDSTYGSMSESLPQEASTGKMGHINQGYEPVSTEDIHAICSEPNPAGVSPQRASNEPTPAPRSARKREAPQPQVSADSPASNKDQAARSASPTPKPAPVKSARVRHTAPKAELQ